MSKADLIYKKLVLDIFENGSWDKDGDVRTVYADGTPAYTKSVFGKQIVFEAGEIPLLTTKYVGWKTALKEIMLFWIHQTVKKEDFHKWGVRVWDEWFLEDGTLGKSYAYQFESRPQKETIKITPKVKKAQGSPLIMQLGDYTSSKNLSDKQMVELKNVWLKMLSKCYNPNDNFYKEYGEKGVFVDERWHSFENFLRDVQLIPQWFLKVHSDKIYYLDKDYYFSNCYSLETCVWQTESENLFYEEDGQYTRRKLSQNQVVDLINNIKTNPTSRRLMTSYWNDTDVAEKALQECAMQTTWNVREGKLDLLLYSRSVDIGLGLPFNWIQYWFLQQMVAQATGLKPGKFIHQMGNVHYYDRHEENLLKQVESSMHKQPEFWINPEETNFFQFTPDDIKIRNYNHNGKIDYEVAI